ncbi:MAG: type II toxin-antitoxin system VapC family toxin [Burkholderiaceae bacterium]|nr:type II toxin-antitoxin system VapC family toxin [Burkholderiaceae bacterium]
MSAAAMAAPPAMAEAYVVDASVGIKLFVEEELSDAAHALFARLKHEHPVRLAVPDLFYIECANILWKYHQRFGLSRADAEAAVEQLGQLLLHSTPTAALTAAALTLAMTHGITAYDAAYIALAQRLAIPVVTADAALLRKLTGAPCDLRWLGDWVQGEMEE